jgi:hypothetical protein
MHYRCFSHEFAAPKPDALRGCGLDGQPWVGFRKLPRIQEINQKALADKCHAFS